MTDKFDPQTWDWWKAAKEQKKERRRPDLPVHDGVLHQGFYAARRAKGGDLLPVAIWYKDGEVRCTIGAEEGKPVSVGRDQAMKVWLSCCYNPIEKSVWDAVVAGKPWPEEIIVTYEDGRTESSMAGHNQPDNDDQTLEDLQEWIDRATKLKKIGTPKTKAEADTVGDVATKLAELWSKADKRREEINVPFLTAQRENNAKFNAKINPAKTLVRDLKTLIGVYIKMVDDARKAKEEEARQKAIEESKNANPLDGELLPPEPAPEPSRGGGRVQVGTRRAVSIRKYEDLVWEGDPTKARLAAMKHFAETMETIRPELEAIIDTITKGLLKAGMKVPGAKLEEKERAV